MKRVLVNIAAALVLTGTTFGQVTENEHSSIDRIKEHLNYLGSDLFTGRAAGTIGAALAAKYLALNLEMYGIQPAGDNNTFYQYIPMHGSKPRPETEIRLFTNGKVSTLNLGEDFLMYGSGDRRYIPGRTKLVFAGYGIIAPEYDYNDYEAIDVEGKIVVVLEGEPNSERADFFEGNNTTVYSYPGSKQRIALSRGALGTIIIPVSDDNNKSSWDRRISEFSFEDIYLAYSVTTTLNLLLNPEAANELFEESQYGWNEVIKDHKSGIMKSFDLSAELTFKGEFNRRDFIGQNVLGLVKGNDPEYNDRCIVISAHYDHLGIGIPVKGDSVYNGVFDNAIGCALLLELARELEQNKPDLKRSLLFLFVTGEEKGLLGSRYYIDHPVYPLYKTSANINIDGVPFIDRFNSIVAFGYRLSSLKDNIDLTSSELGLSLEEIPAQFSGSETFNRSDQIAFANAGIPSILIMNGTDYKSTPKSVGFNRLLNYAKNIYHTPFDDLSQEINYDAVQQYLNFMKKLILNIANAPTEPEWNPGVHYRMERLRSIAEKR